MSAIFNALKKLEEEKSAMDSDISLKELNIDGVGVECPNSLGDKLLQWRGKILLVIAGIILGGLIGKVL